MHNSYAVKQLKCPWPQSIRLPCKYLGATLVNDSSIHTAACHPVGRHQTRWAGADDEPESDQQHNLQKSREWLTHQCRM
jgi:hypothetical protein